jgi:hypothetical protein
MGMPRLVHLIVTNGHLAAPQHPCSTSSIRKRRIPLYLVYQGRDLGEPLYRIVKRCPPTLQDFLSYEALGSRYNRRDFLRGTGISTYLSVKRAEEIAGRFRHGDAIATLDVDCDGVTWAETGARGHVTVWATPDLLLARVVQCVDDVR